MSSSEIGVEAEVRILLTIVFAAMKQHPKTCCGITKYNKPCKNWRGLDSSGHCKFHVPFASQCQGIARSTGVRCRIRWDLNAGGYCCYHECQAPRQYISITPPIKQRFQITSGSDTDSRHAVRRRHDVAYSTHRGIPLYSKTQRKYEPNPSSEYLARYFGQWGQHRENVSLAQRAKL